MADVIKDFIFGCISVEIEKGFYDIFLKECKTNKVQLKNIVICKDTVKLQARYSDAEIIINCADNCKCKILEIKKTGLPYIFFRYRKRYGIPVGLFFGCVIIFILSSLIWSLEIDGNEKLSTERIISTLSENNIRIGVFSHTVNCRDAEYILENTFEEISWISVQVVGSRLFVNIKERETECKINETEEFCNIVAKKNGEIIKADIYKGEGQLLPGTPVCKGDLLVSGVVTFNDGRVDFVDAQAEIWALTENTINIGSALTVTAESVGSYSDKYMPYFFGIDVSGSGNENKSAAESTYLFDAGSVVFPVGIKRCTSYELIRENIELSTEKAILISLSDYAVSMKKLVRTAEIIDVEEKLIPGNEIKLEVILKCKEDIAETKTFTVDNSIS